MTAIGIIVYNTGNLLTNFENSSPKVFANLCWHIGWGTATTGLSLVLWSRLHLVVKNSRLLNFLLVLIPFNGIVINFIAIGVLFGLTLKYNKKYLIAVVLNYFGIITFVILETVLSSLYIYYTARFLKSGYSLHTRKVVGLLLGIQVLVIVFDAMLWSLAFTNLFEVAVLIHPLTQAIKLKLEFIILNQLQSLVKPGGFISDLDVETELSLPVEESNSQPLFGLSDTNSVQGSRSGATTTMEVPMTATYLSSGMQSLMNESNKIQVEESSSGTKDHDRIFRVGVGDTKRVGRKPNQEEEDDDIEKLEELYLGKWGDDTKV
jgi:hypothetical protein